VAYADFRDRYRDIARTLGFEGHIDGPKRRHDDVGIDLRVTDQRWYWPSPQRVGRQTLANASALGTQ